MFEVICLMFNFLFNISGFGDWSVKAVLVKAP